MDIIQQGADAAEQPSCGLSVNQLLASWWSSFGAWFTKNCTQIYCLLLIIAPSLSTSTLLFSLLPLPSLVSLSYIPGCNHPDPVSRPSAGAALLTRYKRTEINETRWGERAVGSGKKFCFFPPVDTHPVTLSRCYPFHLRGHVCRCPHLVCRHLLT